MRIKAFNKFKRNWKEFIVLLMVLVVAGIAHGFNMFGFPYFENDEGVYLSQAWSLVTQGKLAPYTYWYDHSPVGWIFIAIWLLLTRTVFLFGFALNSGRVLMLLVHLISTIIVFKIGKKLTSNIWVGVIAGLLFSISPLGIYFQRRLLLDNIMVMWILLSYMMILGAGKKISHYIYSAIFFGLAVLSKENAIVFLPGFIITMYSNVHFHNKRFAISGWLVVTAMIISNYFLYAFLKGELFPFGSWLGGKTPHVSLLESLGFQSSRTGVSFWVYLKLWLKQDMFLVVMGIIANIAIFLWGMLKRKGSETGLALLGIFFWAFLMRGGLLIEFYILPLIPLMALYIGMALQIAAKKNDRVLIICSILLIVYYLKYGQISRAFPQGSSTYSLYKTNQTAGQLEAVDWIRKYIDNKTFIAIDQYSYLDLHDPNNPWGKTYPNAVWYLKIDHDQEVKQKLNSGNPNKLDLIAKTPQMQVDLWGGASKTTSETLKNSVYIKGFNSNGWGVEIWSNQNFEQILDQTWQAYKHTFIQNGERSIDPMKENITTSEGQSYLMLRSVWVNDRYIFDRVWGWTQRNLQKTEGTFSWLWGMDKEGQYNVLDTGTAADSDTDIALSLLIAYKKWGEEKYLYEAKKIIKGIWETEVKNVNRKYYLTAGNWAKNKPITVINVSYLSPFAFRLFAEVDPQHKWNLLVDTTYEVLEGCSGQIFAGQKTTAFLPPNWCGITGNGSFTAINESGISSTDFSYDAVRTMWRIGLDYKWNKEERAKIFLQKAGVFLKSYWLVNNKITAGFTHEGQPLENYESVLYYSTILPVFTMNPGIADDIYQQKILTKLFINKENPYAYWEDKNNYYLQNWAWFGVAQYADKLPNLFNDL